MSGARADIVEVFSSLQGEGLRLGERQIFVRFGGCNLRCDYCDTPGAVASGAGEPWERERLERTIAGLREERPHAAVAWTGGEPLLQEDFLTGMLEWARAQGLENYLETNGVLAEAMARVAGAVDIAAVDVKLPSAVGRELWDEHAAFLRAVGGRGFVKVVLTEDSTIEEWRRVLSLLEENAPAVPLVLQPATRVESMRAKGKTVRPISAERALIFLGEARRRLDEVKLIAQWHPVWGVR